MAVPSVIVVTSAFGADFVREQGHIHFYPLLAAANADGVEVRRELFTQDDFQLPQLRAAAQQHNLFSIYSAPVKLWRADGTFEADLLTTLIDEATTLDARLLKVTVGHFEPHFDLSPLAAILNNTTMRVLVENEQTPAGTITTMQLFLSTCKAANIPVGMVFDTGNWHWLDIDPVDAAKALGHYVEYVHCKAVTAVEGKLKVVPLDKNDPSWKTLFTHFPANVPRAIEFPLQGPALEDTTRNYITTLRHF
jgi:sugar phosphate isomerase/epimerase